MLLIRSSGGVAIAHVAALDVILNVETMFISGWMHILGSKSILRHVIFSAFLPIRSLSSMSFSVRVHRHEY